MKRMAYILGNICLCVFLAAGSSLPVQADTQAGQPASGPTQIYLPQVFKNFHALLPPIIPDTTRVLPASVIDRLASISADGATFTFTGAPSELWAFDPGDIMVADACPNAPYGFLRRFVSRQVTGGQTIVQTTSAALDEAIQQGEVYIQKALTPDMIRSARYAHGVSLAAPRAGAQAPDFYLEIKDVVLFDNDNDPDTTNDQVLANGSVDVTPTLNFDVLVEDWSIRELLFTLDLHDQVEIEVESRLTLGELKGEQELARYQLAPITVMVSFVPVTVTPILTFVVGVDGSVYVSVSTSVTQEATLSGGMQYQDGDWEPVRDFNNQFGWQPPELSAGLDLKGYAGPRLELLIYGGIGPQLTLDGYLSLEANLLEIPWWKLYGGLELSAGIRVDVLGHKLASFDYPGVIGVKTLLAQAPNVITTIPLSAGEAHTCALTPAGGVKCWGKNMGGQLGDGTAQTAPPFGRLMPVNVVGLASGVSAVSAGSDHTCALTQSGEVLCWGNNGYGQLGDGTTSNRYTPVNVSGLTSGVIAISAGFWHTCALTQAGAVKCWGWNHNGQLGDGTTTQRLTPVTVSGLGSGVGAISAGAYHTCALSQAGGLKCWGNNTSGQVGDGSTTQRLGPVGVFGLSSGVLAVNSGYWHTCAVTATYGLKCWGENETGELGDGSTTRRLTPVDVSGLTGGVSAFDTGRTHTCARTQAGQFKCWGSNVYGELGDGSTTHRLTPVNVIGLAAGARADSAGSWFTCSLTLAGGVSCWGNNDWGELGDGTTTERHSPVDVVGFP